MNSVVRVIPIECINVYEGTSKATGNGYTVGTWKVKGVLDGKEFIVSAFTKDHEILNNSTGLLLDGVITVEGREYNGKWFNDVKISNIVNPDAQKDDLPTDEVKANTVEAPLFPGEENGLPF